MKGRRTRLSPRHRLIHVTIAWPLGILLGVALLFGVMFVACVVAAPR
jgi:hypothetical protein